MTPHVHQHPHGLHVITHHADAESLPVLLVHGAPDRSKNFAGVLQHLTDLRVTVYDRRGYGRSLHAQPPTRSFEDQADDLLGLLEEQPSVVVGQSAGGTIALMAAARRPESFLALGLWEAPVIWADWWPSPEGYAMTVARGRHDDAHQLGEEFNRLILGDDRWEQLPERTRDLLRQEGAAFRADMASQEHAPFRVEDVTVPTIVATGGDTPEILTRAGQGLADAIGAEHVIVPGADHYAHLSNPAAWAGLVRRTVALAESNRST